MTAAPRGCDFFWLVECVHPGRRLPRSASLRAGSVEGSTWSDFPKKVAMVIVNETAVTQHHMWLLPSP
jgi:hypothetical protein